MKRIAFYSILGLFISSYAWASPDCTTESTVTKDNGQVQIIFSCTSTDGLPPFRDALWRQPGQPEDLVQEHQEQIDRWTNWAYQMQNPAPQGDGQ